MKIEKCRGCGAKIIWIKTGAGKNMPLDAEPEKRYIFLCVQGKDDQGKLLDLRRWQLVNTYTPHWATCPNANDFRKGKGGE